jgi:glutathione S-transferase
VRFIPDGAGAGGGGPPTRVAKTGVEPPEAARERAEWLKYAAMLTAETAEADRPLATWFALTVAAAVRALAAPGRDGGEAHRVVRRALDLIADIAGRQRYLSGNALTAADIAAAAALAPIARPEGWRWAQFQCPRRSPSLWPTEYFDHPGSAWVRRLYDLHAQPPSAARPQALTWVP